MADHDHSHEDGHQAPPSDVALRVAALESLLMEKGLVDPAALDMLVDTYEHKIGPRNGGKVVARAWVDPAYKARLLADATAAIRELGFGGLQSEHMVAVENTPKVHNLVRRPVPLRTAPPLTAEKPCINETGIVLPVGPR